MLSSDDRMRYARKDAGWGKPRKCKCCWCKSLRLARWQDNRILEFERRVFDAYVQYDWSLDEKNWLHKVAEHGMV